MRGKEAAEEQAPVQIPAAWFQFFFLMTQCLHVMLNQGGIKIDDDNDTGSWKYPFDRITIRQTNVNSVNTGVAMGSVWESRVA